MENTDKVIELIMDRVGDYTIRKWLKQLFAQYFSEPAPTTIDEKDNRIKVLEDALRKIANWDLPKTGLFWTDGNTKRETSYETEYGSNGVRDYIKLLAHKALFIESKTKEG